MPKGTVKKKTTNKKTTKKASKKKSDDSKLFAFIATFFSIIGFIIVIIVRGDDKYVMFYAKQGLILFVGQILISFISAIPLIGWFVLGPILWVFFAILWIVTWINALSGKQKDTWLIGELAKKIDL